MRLLSTFCNSIQENIKQLQNIDSSNTLVETSQHIHDISQNKRHFQVKTSNILFVVVNIPDSLLVEIQCFCCFSAQSVLSFWSSCFNTRP